MELLMQSLVLQTPMVLYIVVGGASLLVGTGVAFILFNMVVKRRSSNLIKDAEGEAALRCRL